MSGLDTAGEHKTGSQVMVGRYRDDGAISIYTESVGGDLAQPPVIRVSLSLTLTNNQCMLMLSCSHSSLIDNRYIYLS